MIYMQTLNVPQLFQQNITRKTKSTIVYCSNKPNKRSMKDKREFLKRKMNVYKKRDIELIKARQSEFNALMKDFCFNDFVALRDMINEKIDEHEEEEMNDFDLPLESFKSHRDDYIREE